MHKLHIEHVSKVFGNYPERGLALLRQGASKDEIFQKTRCAVGVRDASFHVDAGEIVVVMGLSGSGKSTLLRCLNRLIEPSAGRIFIDGEDITSLDREALRRMRLAKLGMVFQHFALFPHRTVRQNAEYGLEIQGMDPAKRRDLAQAALEQVGLGSHGDMMPRQLSGGMQQRVGLARALALNPDILLMDEAFSALDPLIRRDMQDELITLQKAMQKTIVFVSHDLDEALKLGDRIVLMKDGAIVQVGTPEEILTNPSNEYVERFVEGVDITKVLTAESVMKRTEAVAYIHHDGPRSCLRKMRLSGMSNLFVLDKEHRLVGVVKAEDCARLVEEGKKDLGEIICMDCRYVDLNTPATELIQIIYNLPYPLAVVDDDRRLKGVIVRGTLLGAMAERGRAA